MGVRCAFLTSPTTSCALLHQRPNTARARYKRSRRRLGPLRGINRMRWQSTPYALPLLIASVASAGMAILAWRRRRAPGAIIFMVMVLSVAEWTLGYALELSSASLPAILLWAKLEYIGIVIGPLAALLLAAIPAITLLLVWTNDLHGLIWRATRVSTDGRLALLDVDYGPWFFIYAACAYLF